MGTQTLTVGSSCCLYVAHLKEERTSQRRSNTVLAVSNCVGHDGTSYVVLKHVEVEFWCGTSSCDTGTQCWVHRSMSRLSILVLECSKGSHLEGGHAKQNRNLAFSGGKSGWNWLKFSWNNLDAVAAGLLGSGRGGPPRILGVGQGGGWSSLEKFG